MKTLRVVDSHTAGEPTRVVLSGGPDLGSGSVAEQAKRFRQLHDPFRSAVAGEPRGSEALVAALLCPSSSPDCMSGIIFFNNVGYLGMCGHGTIGVVATLAHAGRLTPGQHCFETPVGIVTTTLHPDGSVSVQNVTSWRSASHVAIQSPTLGTVHGDVAYGGNWFFLTHEHGQLLYRDHTEVLTRLARELRQAVNLQGFPEVDHIELLGPAASPEAHGRSFVLCPGGAYDRSPCGTGTSAHLACLAADNRWPENETWVQEGILGTALEGRYRWVERESGRIQPTIRGKAFVNAESTLILDPQDPFCWGL